MPIQRVQIEDMRAIERITIEPHEQLTLIHGPTASGKSTVIDAVAIGLEREGPGRSFAARDGRHGRQPRVRIETTAGSTWVRKGRVGEDGGHTRIELLKVADRRTPVVVRGTRLRRPRKAPTRTVDHPWWIAADAGLRTMAETESGPCAVQQPERWSDGQAAVLGLFTAIADALARAWPEATAVLAQPAIVLVDRIDLHLEPSTERRLLAELGRTFPHTQVIASTARGVGVATMETDQVIGLEYDEDEGTRATKEHREEGALART